MRNRAATQAALIRQLNPIIRGWSNYHCHAVAKQTFKDLDHYIFKLLWYWARKAHPKTEILGEGEILSHFRVRSMDILLLH
jgi:hypothetical protein